MAHKPYKPSLPNDSEESPKTPKSANVSRLKYCRKCVASKSAFNTTAGVEKKSCLKIGIPLEKLRKQVH